MIKATEFHHEFLKQVNRVNSDYNKRFSVSTRDSYFNHAAEVVLENFYAVAEINSTVRNHLRPLEVKKKKLECKERDEKCCVAEYPEDYYRSLRITAIMCDECCDEEKEIQVHTVQSSKITGSLNDPYWEPSYEWGETVGDESSEGYHVYKKPDQTVKCVYMDYMRKPGKICAPSLLACEPPCYVDSAGVKQCEDKDFNVDSTFLWRKIVDVSVLYALRDLGQLDDFEAKMKEILFVDRLYLK